MILIFSSYILSKSFLSKLITPNDTSIRIGHNATITGFEIKYKGTDLKIGWGHTCIINPEYFYLFGKNNDNQLYKNRNLHGEAYNFGPPAYQNHSVANLVTQMSQHWDRVHWQDISQKEDEPYESGLLKLNCDKALQHLKWHAIWDFERTVQETIDWYRIFYEKPEIIAEQSKVQIRCYQQDAKKFGLPWAQ